MQVDAAGSESLLSGADQGPTAPAKIWPDPPPIQPVVKADDAGAATTSRDRAYSAADASDSLSRKDERTSTLAIPIGLFPAFACGLVVFGFGFRFMTKHAAARRAQENVHEEGVTTSTDDYARPAGIGLADEPKNFGEDDFQSFVSSISGDGALEQISRRVHSPNDVGVREARLARLCEDIGQRLGWTEPEQQHSTRSRLAS